MTIDELRLIGDRVLVRPDAKEDRSEGGLVIPEVVLADNPNYYYVTGVVVKLGQGVRDDVYECANQQCRYQARRQAGERCPVCSATQRFMSSGDRRPFDVKIGDRVHFGRFAGKQIEVDGGERLLVMREIEIRGVLDDAARVTPGYEPARWNKPTTGLTPEITTVPR